MNIYDLLDSIKLVVDKLDRGVDKESLNMMEEAAEELIELGNQILHYTNSQ